MSDASMPSFSFILLTVFKKKNFDIFVENLPFMSPRQPIKLSDWTNVEWNMEDYPINTFV